MFKGAGSDEIDILRVEVDESESSPCSPSGRLGKDLTRVN
jgi:hypothetical protein